MGFLVYFLKSGLLSDLPCTGGLEAVQVIRFPTEGCDDFESVEVALEVADLAATQLGRCGRYTRSIGQQGKKQSNW